MSHTRVSNDVATSEDPLYFHPSRDPNLHPERSTQPASIQPQRRTEQALPNRPVISVTNTGLFKVPEVPKTAATHQYNLRPRI